VITPAIISGIVLLITKVTQIRILNNHRDVSAVFDMTPLITKASRAAGCVT